MKDITHFPSQQSLTSGKTLKEEPLKVLCSMTRQREMIIAGIKRKPEIKEREGVGFAASSSSCLACFLCLLHQRMKNLCIVSFVCALRLQSIQAIP